MDSVRTFIAIELPPPVRDALAQAQATLRAADAAAARSVKWVDPPSIHLTLKFLGDTPVERLDAIGAALAGAVASGASFTLSLARAGCFPTPRQPRVLWVGLGGDLAALSAVQTAVERAIAPLGFPTETRPFSPHLTLGRVRDDALSGARQSLGMAVTSLRLPPARFAVSGVSLMRSELGPGGAVYTRLAEAALAAAAGGD